MDAPCRSSSTGQNTARPPARPLTPHRHKHGRGRLWSELLLLLAAAAAAAAVQRQHGAHEAWVELCAPRRLQRDEVAGAAAAAARQPACTAEPGQAAHATLHRASCMCRLCIPALHPSPCTPGAPRLCPTPTHAQSC